MFHRIKNANRVPPESQGGFTLLETMVALVVLLAVGGIVAGALLQMMRTQGTIQNRTEMHSSVRNATELLSQEIGQAGKISLPPAPPVACPTGQVTLTQAVVASPGVPQNVTVCSATGMFQGELLTIAENGVTQETVTLTAAPAGNTISAVFYYSHALGVPVAPRGAFASGIVPPDASVGGVWPGLANGSNANLLKLYGDINGDGNMIYVEYNCDFTTTPGTLWRNVTLIAPGAVKSAANKVALLTNLLPNPNNTPCFDFQAPASGPSVGTDTYVVDVAVTLTVQTQAPDQQTGVFQKETKALLNISPRNVFEAWELASAGMTTRIQPMPPTVTALLPTP